MRLLLVEDELELADPLAKLLKREGHVVDVSYDGDTAWHSLHQYHYDLVILDWMLPGLSGLEICTRMRSERMAAPVLMLTAKDTIDDKLAGFDAGADDYLSKPFELRELVARVRALLRRPTQIRPDELQIGDLVIDKLNRLARRGNQVIELSAKEYQLLTYFVENQGQLLTHEQIYAYLWGADSEPTSNVVAAQVKLLRRKLDKGFETSLIHTVHGLGYRFVAP
jgi:two-component system, OmpR family, manganese sensing response regulator